MLVTVSESEPKRCGSTPSPMMQFWNVMSWLPSREAEAIPAAPFDAAMIKNHVAAAGKIDGAFALVAGDAFAETQVADDDIVSPLKETRASVKCDALAGRVLPGKRDVAADGDVGLQPDDAADIENDDAMRFADGVAERAGAGIGQSCDVESLAAVARRWRIVRNLPRRERRAMRSAPQRLQPK